MNIFRVRQFHQRIGWLLLRGNKKKEKKSTKRVMIEGSSKWYITWCVGVTGFQNFDSSRDSPCLCLHRLAINLQSECIHMLYYWLHTTFRFLWMALLSTCAMSVLRLKSCSVDFWSFWSEELYIAIYWGRSHFANQSRAFFTIRIQLGMVKKFRSARILKDLKEIGYIY